MRKLIKIVLLITGLIVIGSAIILVVLAEIHKDDIHRKTLEIVNKQFDEQVTIHDFSLSYLHQFPHVNLILNKVEVKDSLKTILTIEKINIALNARALLKKQIDIEKLEIGGLKLDYVVDSLGQKPHLLHKLHSDKKENEPGFAFGIKNILIKNSLIHFANLYKHNHTFLAVNSLQIKPEISNEFTNLGIKLNGTLDSLVANNKTLIKNQPIQLNDAVLAIDKTTKDIELKQGTIATATLLLVPKLKMSPAENGNKIDLEIAIDGKFDEVLSLVELNLNAKFCQVNPAAFVKAKFKQTGITNPFLKPVTEIDFLISDAILEGNALPHPLTINSVKGFYTNGEKHSAETTTIEIDTLNAKIQESILTGSVLVKNLSDPAIDAKLDAKIELSDFLKETAGMKASGQIDADVKYAGKISELKKAHFSGYLGSVKLRNLKIELKQQNRTIEVPSGALTLNNHHLEIPAFNGFINGAPFKFEGKAENPLLHFVNREEDLKASFQLDFDKIELIPQSRTKTDNKQNSWAKIWSVFSNHVSVDLLVKGKKLSVKNTDIKDIALFASQKDNEILIKNISIGFRQNSIAGSGFAKFDKNGLTALNANIKGQINNLDSLITQLPHRDSAGANEHGIPENAKINLELKIGKGTFGPAILTNTIVDASLNNREIVIRTFSANIGKGVVKASGTLNIDHKQFTGGNLVVDANLKRLMIDDLLNKTEQQKQNRKQKSAPAFPEKLTLKLHFSADEVLYADLKMNNLATNIQLVNQRLTIENFKTDFPFGNVVVKGNVSDLFSENRKIKSSVSVNIDSVSIDKLLAMKAFEKKSKPKKTETPDHKTKHPFFPENLDFSFDINARKLIYKKAHAENVVLMATLNKNRAEIKKLDFSFASGTAKINGYAANSGSDFVPCYLSTEINDVDIQQLLPMFDNFDQEVITPENTTGLFSWKSNHHFSINSDFVTNIDDNIWFFDFNIHNVTLTNVGPIQNALFFIGHKAKSNMIVKDLKVNAYMNKDKLLFSEVLMNDNIANLEIFGSYSLTDTIMDFGSKVSLTDVFFRSKKERILETNEGIVPLEQDAKVFIRMQGSPANHKIQLHSRKKLERFEKELLREIEKANKNFAKKEKERKAAGAS